MGDDKPRSVIKRVYVPTYVKIGPHGERVIVPGHYTKSQSD